MKILLPIVLLVAAAAGAAAAWFTPIRGEIVARPGPVLNPAGQAMTMRPLSSLTPEDRAAAEDLRKRVDALEAKLDAHDAAMAAAWNSLIGDASRENARRQVEGGRIAGVVNSTGGKGVEHQVADLMDDTARNRMRGILRGWIEGETTKLKTRLDLAPQQSLAIDQILQDIQAEESAKIDQGDPGENFMGWRGDILESARVKLAERVDVVLTSDQKEKAKEFLSVKDWGRAFRGDQEGEGK